MRKVLSFVLVLSLVLGSFSMAFAATPAGLSDVAGNANQEAIQIVNDLGIVTGYPDGTFGPAKAVTRAEFAAMLTRALALPESALAGYATTSFKDTANYTWAVPYLAFCESKGIMLGDGQGNAMPGRTITVNEAMAMALRTVGYTNNSSDLVGSYPANYVTLAQTKDLYDDVNAVATVDRASAAQIIYNALTVQKVSVNTDGDTKPQTKGDGTVASLMTTGLGCKVVTGEAIDGNDFDLTKININKIIGATGTAYKDKDDKIVAFDADSTALNGKMKANSTDTFVANGVEYTFKTGTTVNSTVSSILNAGTATNALTLGGVLAAADSGKVTLNVKLVGKTIDTIHNATYWQATKAKKVSSSDLAQIAASKSLLTYSFKKDTNNVIDTTQFALLGATDVNSIKKDSVVYIYAPSGSTTIRQIAVGTGTATGKITATNSSADYAIVNGSKYYTASLATGINTEISGLVSGIIVGSTVDFALDYFGDVYKFSSVDSANKYALIKGFQKETANSSTTIASNAKANFFVSEDATKTYDFVMSDDFTGSTTDLTTSPAAFVAGDLVKYNLNAAGDVDTAYVASSTTASVYLQSTKVVQIGSTFKTVADNVVVFLTTTTPTYEVGDIANVKTGVEIGGTFQYVLNNDGAVAAMSFVKASGTNYKGTSDHVYGVINNVDSVKNADDEVVNQAAGFANGSAATWTFTKTASATYPSAAAVDAVNLFDFAPNASSVITAATPITQSTTTAGVATNEANGVTVSSISTGTLTVFTGTNSVKYSAASNAVVYKAVFKAGEKVDYYEVASLSDIGTNDLVWLFDTKTTNPDHNGIANVIIFRDK